MADESRILIGLFTRHKSVDLREALAQEFSDMPGVAVVDYTGMEDELAQKTVGRVDIAIISADSFNDPQIKPKTAMLAESAAYAALYDSGSAEAVINICEQLLGKKCSLLHCSRVDDAEDCEIFAQSVHSVMIGIRQTRIRLRKTFEDGLREELGRLKK